MDVERAENQPDSAAPPLKVFVAWDFSDAAERQLLQGCREFPAMFGNLRPIEWLVPGITLAAAGDIGRDIVEASIRAADRTIALVDNANANVAWEAGLAMGLGKPVGLGVLRPTPIWAQQGALEGQFLEHLKDYADLCRLVEAPNWRPPKLTDVERSSMRARPPLLYVLCPGGPEGSNVRRLLQRDNASELLLAPEAGHTLKTITAALGNCTRALWIVCLHTQASGGDGDHNASNALIAGLLRGWGFPLQIQRSAHARALADLAGETSSFDDIDQLRTELLKALAVSAVPPPGPQLPHAIRVPSGLGAARLQHLLQTHFCERSTQIQTLAQRVGIERIPEQGLPDQIWAEILRQASKQRLDIRPLVEVLLIVEPGNEFLKELVEGWCGNAGQAM